MEPRLLLSVQPVHVGAVYIEEDLGSDLHGDSLLVTFEGGAPETQLLRLEIRGDQNGPGFGVGDVFFDTEEKLTGSGHQRYGADHAFPLTVLSNDGVDQIHSFVDDGTSTLVLEFVGFDAGDQLVFSVDVDEVEDFDPQETDVQVINDGFDPITSGVEFQGSTLTATLAAPHFATADTVAEFLNRYDPQLDGTNLDLPADDFGGKRDRSAGAVGTLQQQAIPATISGHVYHDRNQNGRRDAGEEGLADVAVEAVPLRTVADQSVQTASTDATGYYEFASLMPGSYRLVETTQPHGYLDGLDAAGTVDGRSSGQATNPGDTIDAIFLAGGASGQDYDFGEFLPVSLQGQVHLATPDGDCFGTDDDQRPVAGAVVRLQDEQGALVAETKTDPQGYYQFIDLLPGTYSLVEITPAGLLDGGAQAGRVDGQSRGTVIDGGYISQIQLVSGEHGQDYDFCELEPVSLSGSVYHDRNDDGRRDGTEEGLSKVNIDLVGADGRIAATTQTDAGGAYEFVGRYAGTYSLQQTQPTNWLDGRDRVGTVDGVTVGTAVNPGDRIEQIQLRWGDEGVDYDFGELLPVGISGKVCLSTTRGDCDSEDLQHEPLPDVVVELLDEAGQLLRQTVTDAFGRYTFVDLLPGRYSVHEITPAGLIDGQAGPGLIDGHPAGIVRDPNTVTDILLLSGQRAKEVDFCEHAPASLSGHVFHDADNDGRRSPTEQTIARVQIVLVDESNQVVATAQTDANGFYQLGHESLRAGTYTVRQIQPEGWWDGKDRAGRVDGQPSGQAQNPGDEINQIQLGWGQTGVDYDFGELLPASIEGLVHVDLNNDAQLQDGESPLPNVRIELLDADGQLVQTTVTDHDGRFRFPDLLPGVYTLREIQPDGYFSAKQRAGTGGGRDDVDNLISDIRVQSGDHWVDYVFCEEPPAEVSGYVFQDGPVIELQLGETLPEDLSTVRDGQLTPDDRRLASVVLELRHGIFGTPILGQSALPGTYPDGPIIVSTDSQGFYRFTGLRKGNYAIYENQPAGLLDGIDSHGTVPAIAINRYQGIQLEMLDALEKDPNFDAIIRIVLPPGQVSLRNNFSEIAVDRSPPVPVEVPPPTPIPPPPPREPLPPPAGRPQWVEPQRYELKPFGYVNGAWGKTWHLSIVDGGQPRGEGVPAVGRGPVWRDAQQTYPVSWQSDTMNQLRWTFVIGGEPRSVERFGMADGIPVVGDFNGDGLAEIGVFFEGQWFIDLNGNGVWDEDDLWAKLGHAGDLPVTGDWDGDGKDDIGIFGLAWPGDPRAVAHEPGLPDRQNEQQGTAENVPPSPAEAPHDRRTLQRGAKGQPRADLIDHVFHYGETDDRPVTGDWNGDGICTIGIYHHGRWHLDRDGDGDFTERDIEARFGGEGDMPVVGDFNGDGIDEIAVYCQGRLIIDTNRNYRIDEGDQVLSGPHRGERLVVGDFNGDGVDDVAFVEGPMRFAEVDPRE